MFRCSMKRCAATNI